MLFLFVFYLSFLKNVPVHKTNIKTNDGPFDRTGDLPSAGAPNEAFALRPVRPGSGVLGWEGHPMRRSFFKRPAIVVFLLLVFRVFDSSSSGNLAQAYPWGAVGFQVFNGFHFSEIAISS